MNFERFLDQIKEFADEYQQSNYWKKYQKYINGTIRWTNPGKDDFAKIFDFLNKWGGCRISRNYEILRKKIETASPYLQPLLNVKLQEARLSNIVEIETEEEPREHIRIDWIIHFLYDLFYAIDGFGSTATSKLLHLAAPRLIVLWDEEIKQNYGMEGTAYEFAFSFLPKMKGFLEEIIHDIQEKKAWNRQQALTFLTEKLHDIHGAKRTLAKTIDEYNWRVYKDR